MRCKPHWRAICRALWLPKCPSSTKEVNESTPAISWQQGVEPAGDPPQLRRESPVGFGCILAALWTPRTALCPAALWVAWLPLVALLTAFSALLRTTCSTRLGNERRCWRLTKDNAKKASPGTGLPYRLERTDRGHGCVLPALVTTTASPTSR